MILPIHRPADGPLNLKACSSCIGGKAATPASDPAIVEVVVAFDVHRQKWPVVAPAFVLRQFDLLLGVSNTFALIDSLLHRSRQVLQVSEVVLHIIFGAS